MINTVKTEAKVILLSDGSVHIAFRNLRSIYATAENLSEFFSSPIDFIRSTSLHYEDSTDEVFRKRTGLENVSGLTLAVLNSDKQILCHFPELFQHVFLTVLDKNDRKKHLDMSSIEHEEILSDEKSFLLKFYLDFTKNYIATAAIKENIALSAEVQAAIMREILNVFYDDKLPKQNSSTNIEAKIEQMENDHLFKSESEGGDMVLVKDYAKIYKMTINTVRDYIAQGKFQSATKNERGWWMIDKNERPNIHDRRRDRKKQGYYKKPTFGSAADVAEYIKEQKLFTPEVANYIHSMRELGYYRKRNYREVCWNGRHCLIIDVNPEYISTKTGIRNRDLMKEGKSPVVAQKDKEEYEYHVHHIGQRSNSPFAIIPSYDHNKKGLSAALHQNPSQEELHGKEFAAQKKAFWITYLEEYDKAGRYEKIEYLNPRYKGKSEG